MQNGGQVVSDDRRRRERRAVTQAGRYRRGDGNQGDRGFEEAADMVLAGR